MVLQIRVITNKTRRAYSMCLIMQLPPLIYLLCIVYEDMGNESRSSIKSSNKILRVLIITLNRHSTIGRIYNVIRLLKKLPAHWSTPGGPPPGRRGWGSSASFMTPIYFSSITAPVKHLQQEAYCSGLGILSGDHASRKQGLGDPYPQVR